MSEYLFARPDRALHVRLALLAVVVAVLAAAGSAWLGLSFIGVVGRDLPVTVQVTTVGDSLGVNSSVKFRGLRIGRVLRLENGARASGSYAVKAVIQRKFADQVPATVLARVLPGTIFGADYVDLVGSQPNESGASAAVRPIRSGSVIRADASAPTIRLMDTFNATQRVLGALDPGAMDAALSQLASALDGKGAEIGKFITRANRLLARTGRAEPAFYQDLALIARNARTLAEVEPVLVSTLQDSLPLARTIATKARSTQRLVESASRLAGDVATFLDEHGAALNGMLTAVAPTYAAFVGGIVPFSAILQETPGVLRNGALAVQNRAIQMRAQFNLNLVNPYDASDCPRYDDLKGPNCR
ncbi:MAG: hypothetical protein JWQ74_1285 [Marmoricola sp.]|nr:hypothetical protein [Marmoricola sp.]